MLHGFDQILKAALALPPGTRAMLADHLLASLDGPTQKEIDAAWAEEIERRIREIVGRAGFELRTKSTRQMNDALFRMLTNHRRLVTFAR
jgi:hypothetical protein